MHMCLASVCRSSFYHLRNLSRIRKYLTKESAAVVVHAFVPIETRLLECIISCLNISYKDQGRSQYEANRGTCLSHFFREFLV